MPRAKAVKRGSKSSRKPRSKTRSKTRSKAKPKSKSRAKSQAKSRARATKTRTKSKSKSVKKRVTLQDVRKIGNKLNVDFSNLDPKALQYGMKVELEHGYVDRRTNVTNNDLTLTAKIALAHIVEFPDYYDRLKKMEEDAERYWKNKKKVDPFKKK